MAKSKPSNSSRSTESQTKPAAASKAKSSKGDPTKDSSAKKQSGTAAVAPQINPTAAAAAAAAMVAHKSTSPTAPAEDPTKESAAFKHLKEGLNKPHATAINNLLDKTAGPAAKKSGMPFGGNRQVGHNQTFGADVNRHSIPRRTGG